MKTTPDINFVRHRKPCFFKPSVRELLTQFVLTVSETVLITTIAGYGALLMGRDIPTALTLGSVASASAFIHNKLSDEEN